MRPILHYACDRCGAQWNGQTDACSQCERTSRGRAAFARIVRQSAPTAGHDTIALAVAQHRTLPARWRRYASPGPLVIGAAGGWALWLLPISIQMPLIIALLVATVAIRRYVPDALPAARVRR